MTYEEFKAERATLTKDHQVKAERLRENFPIDGKVGYTQRTLDNPCFKSQLSAERAAFRALQDFNQSAPREYKRRAAKEKRIKV